MGFDENGNDLQDTAHYNRAFFYNKAVNILTASYLKAGSFSGKDNQIYRAYELIQYLQAHDYLMTASGAGAYTYNNSNYENTRSVLDDFTHNLYGKANNLWASLGVYNNMSLIVAGAIGMSAVVLSDKETYWWEFQRKPSRWANAAHAYINRTLWTGPSSWAALDPFTCAPGPMSDTHGIAGYAEGPHYFEISFESLLPFFRSFDNFVDGQDITGNYYTNMLDFFSEKVRNYLHDDNYDNLYKWHSGIRMPNGEMPSYDDSYTTYATGVLAITQNPDYSRTTDFTKLKLVSDVNTYSIREDYLAAFNHPSVPHDNPEFLFKAAGDLVARTPWDASLDNSHYFHMSGENGTALHGIRYCYGVNTDEGHEHGDAGSFIIGAGEDVLAIDPAMYGWNYRDDVNSGDHHNVITIDGNGPDPKQSSIIDFDPLTHIGTLETTYTGTFGEDVARLKREVEIVNNGAGIPYYLIDDDVTNLRWWESIYAQFNLNGNGLSSATVPSFHIDPDHSNVAVWDHPCKKDHDSSDNWKMRATILSQINGTSASNIWNYQNGSTHGTNAENYTGYIGVPINNELITSPSMSNITNYVYGGDAYKGEHTRATLQLSLAPGGTSHPGDIAHFYVKIEVLRCTDDTTPISPFVQNANHTVHTAQGYSNGKYYNIHYSRTSGLYGYDTVINPLSLDTCTKVFGTDARKAFLSYAEDSTFKSNFCTSYTNFRKASINDGDSLNYGGETYITCDTSISAFYQIVGKYKYDGNVTAPSGGANVTFAIPDLDYAVPMVALKGYGSSLTVTYYDSTDWKHITVSFPEGTTNFTIQPENPCSFDCYFPPLGVDINDTTFNVSDMNLHTLGHKLTVLNHGLLNVTQGSRIDMCSDVYLHNRDSIIVEGPCQATYKAFDPCSGITNLCNTDPSSAIIVSGGSALVLDSGSYTYLKAGGAIWVKANGSLIIKNNAFVQIGDSPNFCGYGEIITETGAYLTIEPNAHIEYARTIGDTVDRNLFYVAPGTIAGVYSSMATILNTDTVFSPLTTPTDICALDTINPVKNREWGYCNVMHPLATYQTRSDTICPGEALCIYLDRILNSDSTGIFVCRKSDIHKDSFAIVDLPVRKPPTYHYRITDTIAPYYFHYLDTCIQDTFWHDSIPPGDHPCTLLHTIPDNICYYFKPNTLHRITITTRNDCGVRHDTVGYVFVADSPQFSISVPDTVCPGTMLTVNVTDINHQPGDYTFGIEEIPDSTQLANMIANPADTNGLADYYESHSGYLPDTFSFSNFNIKGNRTYAVSLTVANSCGSYSVYHSTTSSFYAKIDLHLASTYNNPVGPAAFQLEGSISTGASFHWSPTTYLSDSTILNPVSMPPGAIQYILTATGGGCTDRDTVTVLHNTIAYAGYSREICSGSSVVLGTDNEAAIYLGMLDYLGGPAFESQYSSFAMQWIDPPGYWYVLPWAPL